MSFSSKQIISLLRPSLLFIIIGFSFLWGQKKYTASADLTIPANVIKMTVKAWGAGGGGGGNGGAAIGDGAGGTGGSGGFSQTTVTVQSGEIYRVLVGNPGGFRRFRWFRHLR
jgi:hypothetical protein